MEAMRLGGSVIDPYENAQTFTRIAKDSGYSTVVFPFNPLSSDEEINAYVAELKDANISIAEVGAWRSNPLDQDLGKRREAIQKIQERLALADQVGAACCVNVAGSLSEKWDAPHMDSLNDDVFALIVDTIREIIDAVKPRRTFYTLETMPWMVPFDPDSYLKLIQAVDRKEFGVHLDIINMINSPILLYRNAAFTQECFDKLGPFIKSIHIKDMTIEQKLTVHLNECLVGEGFYHFRTFFDCAAKLPADMPVLVEHIKVQSDFERSVRYLRSFAYDMGIDVQ